MWHDGARPASNRTARKYGRAYRETVAYYIAGLSDAERLDWLRTSSLNRKVRGR